VRLRSVHEFTPQAEAPNEEEEQVRGTTTEAAALAAGRATAHRRRDQMYAHLQRNHGDDDEAVAFLAALGAGGRTGHVYSR